MGVLINDENIWGGFYNIYGDAKNVNGDVSGVYGDITGFTGCCSCIGGNLNAIKTFTTDFEEIRELYSDIFKTQHHLDFFTSGRSIFAKVLDERFDLPIVYFNKYNWYDAAEFLSNEFNRKLNKSGE